MTSVTAESMHSRLSDLLLVLFSFQELAYCSFDIICVDMSVMLMILSQYFELDTVIRVFVSFFMKSVKH